MSRQPHVLVIPAPAQGHVTPLMKLATKIAEHGIKVTFVNTEFVHAQIMASSSSMEEKRAEDSSRRITFVSIPDGLEEGDDRQDLYKMNQMTTSIMPGFLKNLIEKINSSNDCEEPISCVVADNSAGWALEVAEQMGIARAAFIPYEPGCFALSLHIPKLLEAGILDANGFAKSNELISLSDEIPAWKRNEYPWSFPAEPIIQKIFFGLSLASDQAVKNSNWVLNNSIYELHSVACDLIPKILPIGPLLASNNSGDSVGSYWPEDSTCLSWLDKQATGSVIYVAFGSLAILSQQQFEELAFGLESIQQPFLWVVRQDLVIGSHAEFLDDFAERVSGRGKIVKWAPQEKVLGHSSVACFLSHCGWNSTMEGLSMGVPFLCWPYFADQHHNRDYICDAWKIGSRFSPDENGVITRQEIRRRVIALLKDDDIKANSLKLKKVARKSIAEGGSSFRNFESFISQINALGC